MSAHVLYAKHHKKLNGLVIKRVRKGSDWGKLMINHHKDIKYWTANSALSLLPFYDWWAAEFEKWTWQHGYT